MTYALLKNNYHEILDKLGRVSGWKSKKFHLPEDSWCTTFSEQIYVYKNNISIEPKCYCGNKVKFYKPNVGYLTYCSDICAQNSKIVRDKIKQTNEERYGGIGFASDKLRNKSNKTYKLSTGYSMPAKDPEIIKRRVNTRIENGFAIPKDLKSDYRLYYQMVTNVTNSNNLSKLENIKLRGRLEWKNNYHLDHEFSIFDGFNQFILPVYIGHISNLKMIPAVENLSKGRNSSITLDELIERYKGEI